MAAIGFMGRARVRPGRTAPKFYDDFFHAVLETELEMQKRKNAKSSEKK